MKRLTTFQCEKCGATYTTKARALTCETQPTVHDAQKQYPAGLVWGHFYPNYCKIYLQLDWEAGGAGGKRGAHKTVADTWEWKEVAGVLPEAGKRERFYWSAGLGRHEGLGQHPAARPGSPWHLQHPVVQLAYTKALELGLTPTWWDGSKVQPFPKNYPQP